MPRPMKAAGRSARPSRLRAIWPKVPRSALSRGSAILSVTIVAMVLASTPLGERRIRCREFEAVSDECPGTCSERDDLGERPGVAPLCGGEGP